MEGRDGPRFPFSPRLPSPNSNFVPHETLPHPDLLPSNLGCLQTLRSPSPLLLLLLCHFTASSPARGRALVCGGKAMLYFPCYSGIHRGEAGVTAQEIVC